MCGIPDCFGRGSGVWHAPPQVRTLEARSVASPTSNILPAPDSFCSARPSSKRYGPYPHQDLGSAVARATHGGAFCVGFCFCFRDCFPSRRLRAPMARIFRGLSCRAAVARPRQVCYGSCFAVSSLLLSSLSGPGRRQGPELLSTGGEERRERRRSWGRPGRHPAVRGSPDRPASVGVKRPLASSSSARHVTTGNGVACA